MLTRTQLAGLIGIYGLVVIGSGVIRYLGPDSSTNGLYFGLVLGGWALLGAGLVALNQVLAGRIFAAMAIAVVVMYFSYDVVKDLSNSFKITGTEIRKAFLVIGGLVTAVLMCLPLKNRSPVTP